MDTSLRQKVNKKTISLAFLDIDQMSLIHIYGIFNSVQCIFFSSAHGTFSKIDHMLSKNRSPR